jgi:hypothetical protein
MQQQGVSLLRPNMRHMAMAPAEAAERMASNLVGAFRVSERA